MRNLSVRLCIAERTGLPVRGVDFVLLVYFGLLLTREVAIVRSSSLIRLALASACVVALAACDSSEERAEGHYQSALALLEEGDVERALVEFRNVFKLDGEHREARMTYAKTVMAQGNMSEAYSQFLRLVEQFPDDLEGRRILAEMAFQGNSWEEFDRHSAAAIKLNSDDPAVQAIKIASDYRTALLDEKDLEATAAATAAEELIQTLPDNPLLLRIIIEDHLKNGRYGSALDKLDVALAQQPNNRALYSQKLLVLNQLADVDGIEQVLKDMISRFDEDMNLKAMLIRFYMSRDEMDEAEGFLREISDPTDPDPDSYLSLVRFLLEQRGVEAALAELNSAIEANPSSVLLRNLRAGIDFEEGRREEAMSDLETLLAQAGEDADQGQLLQVKVTLARMFMTTGNEVGARRLVGETLEQDASQVDALKMQAAWQIEADETDEAVSTLRAALDQNPQDAQAMTLMAQAYTRSGSHELARDFLSLAVEASGNAPAEAIRYAAVLTSEGRYQAAESTLLSARRVDPSDVGVLQELGRVYLATKDPARIAQVIDTLRRLETPAALRAADALQVQNLSSKDGASGAINFLEQLAENDNNLNAKIAIVRARLVSGDTTSAYEYAKAILAEDPENPILQYTWYATLAATGDTESALEGYRKILADNPTSSRIWLEVARLTTAQGKLEEARAAIEEGLENVPLSGPLLWAKASYLERDGAYEEAIAIYETLYEQDSNHLVVANNLASMLSTYRDDEESLTRAFNVSRRLRGTEIPQLRDTYGWILHLRGDQEEALLYMEPAAAAMPREALVQYRLGAIYEAMNKPDEALIQFKKAVQLAGEIDTRPEIERARAVILEAGK